MKLLLFVLLCIVTLFIIRSIQGRSIQGGSTRGRGSRPPGARSGEGHGAPPVPPDDIVDVPFKDVEESGKKPPEGD